MKRAVVLAALLAACAERKESADERPADEKVALGGETAVRVGGTPIPLSLVAAVASAQHLSASEAARRVADDEIAASAARARGLDRKEPAAWNLVSTRARIVADHVAADAANAGPPTDEEIALLSERHWAEVDRPPTFRVQHALVVRPKEPAKFPAAKALADQLHAAVASAKTGKEFDALAKTVPHSKDLDVRLEYLGTPFTADGRSVDGGNFDATFAAASAALPAHGDISGVVETPFGWHIIRMVDRLPAARMTVDDRRVAFREEVIAMRGQAALGKLMDAVRRKRKIEVLPTAETLMASVKIGSAPQASLP